MTNFDDGTVTAIDTGTNTPVGTIPVGSQPADIVSTPGRDRRLCARTPTLDTISVIDTITNVADPSTISVSTPDVIAFTPDGARAYVGGLDSFSAIDTATRIVTGPLGSVGEVEAIAITPDGAYVYMPNYDLGTVSVIATATNTVDPTTIPVGSASGPHGIAITPDGAFAYVTNTVDDTVKVIDTTTNTVVDTVNVGAYPTNVAITPDGARAYVVNRDDGAVSVIDTATNSVVGLPIPVGNGSWGIAITPDGARAYVVELQYRQCHGNRHRDQLGDRLTDSGWQRAVRHCDQSAGPLAS